MFILLLLFVVWKWRKNRNKTQRNTLDQREREMLMKSKHKRSEQQLQEEQRRRKEKRREKQKRKEEVLKEIETIKTKLQQLIEEIERKANELQIQQEELEKKNKEMEEFINTRSRSYSYSLLEDKQLETAEAQLKKTNKELKRQLKSMKYESVRQLMREFNKQLCDQKQKKEEAERELKQLITKNTEIEKKLHDEKTKREEAEKEVENLKKEMEDKVNASGCNVLEVHDSQSFHQDKSSSASQSSTTKPLIVIEVDKLNQYVRLINTSHQDQQLGEWILQVQFNDTKLIKYKFDRSFTLRSRNTVNIWVPHFGRNHPPSNLVWNDLKPWSNTDNLHFTLISNTEEIQHQLSL